MGHYFVFFNFLIIFRYFFYGLENWRLEVEGATWSDSVESPVSQPSRLNTLETKF